MMMTTQPMSIEEQVQMMTIDQRLRHELNNSLFVIAALIETALREHGANDILQRALARAFFASDQVKTLAHDIASAPMQTMAIPLHWLRLDDAVCELLEIQEHDPERGVWYYLLRENPAVTVIVCDGRIEDCQGAILPVAAAAEWCLGLFDANAEFRGEITSVVTLFCGKRRDSHMCVPEMSGWLADQYLNPKEDHGR